MSSAQVGQVSLMGSSNCVNGVTESSLSNAATSAAYATASLTPSTTPTAYTTPSTTSPTPSTTPTAYTTPSTTTPTAYTTPSTTPTAYTTPSTTPTAYTTTTPHQLITSLADRIPALAKTYIVGHQSEEDALYLFEDTEDSPVLIALTTVTCALIDRLGDTFHAPIWEVASSSTLSPSFFSRCCSSPTTLFCHLSWTFSMTISVKSPFPMTRPTLFLLLCNASVSCSSVVLAFLLACWRVRLQS